MDGTGFIINQLYNIIFVISLRKLDLPAWTFDLVHLMIWETLLNGVRDAKLLIEGTPIAVLRANIALLSINRTIQIKHILLCNQKHAYINTQHSFSFDISCESHHVYASEIHKNTPQQFKQIVHLNVLYIMSYTHVWTCAIAAVFILGN